MSGRTDGRTDRWTDGRTRLPSTQKCHGENGHALGAALIIPVTFGGVLYSPPFVCLSALEQDISNSYGMIFTNFGQ